MSVKVYDEAVTNKIKSLFSNTVFQTRELTFKTVTDKDKDVKFPLISIFRPDGWSISSENSWIKSREFLGNIRSVFVDLSYQIDIYSNTREDLEDITAEIVLYLLRNPGVQVVYESSDKTQELECNSYLNYVSGPERTSELEDTTVGRPYRYTLVYGLLNAQLVNFSNTEDPSSPDYISKVTEVIVAVEEVKASIKVDGEGNVKVTKYTNKEEVIK